MIKCNLLNVNIPDLSLNELKGIKVCAQGEGHWKEEFQEGKDPRGESYFWLAGQFVKVGGEEKTDLDYLDEGYVTVVPSHHDLTAHQAISEMSILEE
jgi:5'-nucleotidase